MEELQQVLLQYHLIQSTKINIRQFWYFLICQFCDDTMAGLVAQMMAPSNPLMMPTNMMYLCCMIYHQLTLFGDDTFIFLLLLLLLAIPLFFGLHNIYYHRKFFCVTWYRNLRNELRCRSKYLQEQYNTMYHERVALY